jgi:hypothetical protein
MDHELLLLLNNVDSKQREAVVAEVAGRDHRLLELDRPMLDLAAYFWAADLLEHDQLCFLNSYSEILEVDWLLKLADALRQPGAGIVGATGSWASMRSGALNGLLLPNAYRGLIPPRSVARVEVAAIQHELALEREPDDGGGPPLQPLAPDSLRPRLRDRIVATLRALASTPEHVVRFDAFPAEHLRTNAFMARRETLLAMKLNSLTTKPDTYLLESGRQSITRQVQAGGSRVLVVDRQGAAYAERDWPASYTLWQGDQEGLLVADNQTRTYARGGIERRRLLSAFAWGAEADPRLPHGEIANG